MNYEPPIEMQRAAWRKDLGIPSFSEFIDNLVNMETDEFVSWASEWLPDDEDN